MLSHLRGAHYYVRILTLEDFEFEASFSYLVKPYLKASENDQLAE